MNTDRIFTGGTEAVGDKPLSNTSSNLDVPGIESGPSRWQERD